MAIAFLVVAGCALTIDIGKDDGIDPITLDETVRVPGGTDDTALVTAGAVVATVAPASDGGRAVTIARSLEVFSAAASARLLARVGPDKIGAIRGVTLEVVSAQYDGVDLAQTGAPTIRIGGHVVAPGASVDLDDAEVDHVRVALLTPTALDLPVSFAFHEPPGAGGAVGSSVHLRVVVQPTLHVDIGRSW